MDCKLEVPCTAPPPHPHSIILPGLPELRSLVSHKRMYVVKDAGDAPSGRDAEEGQGFHALWGPPPAPHVSTHPEALLTPYSWVFMRLNGSLTPFPASPLWNLGGALDLALIPMPEAAASLVCHHHGNSEDVPLVSFHGHRH